MKEIITKLEIELEELNKKYTDLDRFLNTNDVIDIVGDVQYDLLTNQYFHMEKYKNILEKRIQDLQNKID